MDVQENDSTSIHIGQLLMRQYFNRNMLQNDFQFPLQKEDDQVSLHDINSLNASQYQVQMESQVQKRYFERELNDFKSYNLDLVSPSSSLVAKYKERDLQNQEEQSKQTELKVSSKQGIDETIQSSQLVFLNHNQKHKEKQYFDANQKEKLSVDEKSKKNSVHSPFTVNRKYQIDGESVQIQGVRFEDQSKQNDTINKTQNPTLKYMIHLNKVSNIKKKFINSLIRTCSSAIFKKLTRKQFNILNDSSSDFGYFIHSKQQLIYSEVNFLFS